MNEGSNREFPHLKLCDHIGGFLVAPTNYSNIILTSYHTSQKNPFKRSGWYYHFIGIVVGITLAFFVFYPEVYLIPNIIQGELTLFIFMLTEPAMIIGACVGGYLLTFGFDYLIQGSVSYLFLRSSITANMGKKNLRWWDYLKIYGFGQTYILFFMLTLILWIFFFERFSFAKTFFPVANVTIPFMIQVGTLILAIVGKWLFEMKINGSILSYYGIPSQKPICFIILYKLVIISSLVIGIIIISNVISAMFS